LFTPLLLCHQAA